MNDGHARSNWTLPDNQLAAARDERGVSDLDARDVGDGVEWTGGPTDRKPELTSSSFGRLS
jgi:hypothetical protein